MSMVALRSAEMVTSQAGYLFRPSNGPMKGHSDADAAELGEGACEGNARAHQELGALWWDKLGRIDRAIHHYRRAWELGRGPDAMAALRAIAASLGDEATVRSLYEEELSASKAPARQALL